VIDGPSGRPPGRVQRVPEADDPCELQRSSVGASRDVGCKPPTHGSTADEEGRGVRWNAIPDLVNDIEPRALEHGGWVGTALACLNVGEIERKGAEAALREVRGERDDRPVILAGTGAMRQDEHCQRRT
jgi:hypothetical protein